MEGPSTMLRSALRDRAPGGRRRGSFSSTRITRTICCVHQRLLPAALRTFSREFSPPSMTPRRDGARTPRPIRVVILRPRGQDTPGNRPHGWPEAAPRARRPSATTGLTSPDLPCRSTSRRVSARGTPRAE